MLGEMFEKGHQHCSSETKLKGQSFATDDHQTSQQIAAPKRKPEIVINIRNTADQSGHNKLEAVRVQEPARDYDQELAALESQAQ